MGIVLYISSVGSSVDMKKKQQRIQMVLEGKHIEYKVVDIATDTDGKTKMREISGEPKSLPPQIANGDQYCGDFANFDNAVEMEELASFLKL